MHAGRARKMTYEIVLRFVFTAHELHSLQGGSRTEERTVSGMGKSLGRTYLRPHVLEL